MLYSAFTVNKCALCLTNIYSIPLTLGPDDK